MKKIISLLLVLSLTLSFTVSVFATDEEVDYKEMGLEFQQNRLANIQKEIIRNQSYIEELNKKTSYLTNEVQKLDDYILEIQETIDLLNAEIETEEQQLNIINENKKKKIESFNKIKEEYIKTRVRLLKIQETENWLEQTTVKDIKNKTEILVDLSDNYTTILEKQNNKLNQINASASLSQLSSSTKKQEKETIEKKQALLQSQQNQKIELIQKYYADAQNKNEQIDDLEISSNEVANAIRKLQSLGYKNNSNLLKGKGVLSYPCEKGRLTSDYGMRIHPIYKTRKMHTGIDIGGNSTGTPVLASADGIVITAGWLSGYGYTIIIDHGNQISTLYAHNSKLTVKVGQEVKRGQQIAKVGSTGNSTGPHIHFEVRVNGEHTNPMEWL